VTATDRATASEASPGYARRWWVLATMTVCLLVVITGNTILNVAIPTLQRELGATQGELQWAVDAYILVFAGLLFSWGVIGDRIGRKRVLLIGLSIFALGSVFAAFSDSPIELIGWRAVMGIGGAAVQPTTLAVITNVFPPRERGRAIGVWAGAVGLGVAIGPIVGGLLLEHFWWGSVFLINVPIVVVGIVLVTVLIPESRDPKPGKIDFVGVLLSIIGLTLLTYGVIKGGEDGFGDTLSWGTMVASVLVLTGFVLYERRLEFPALDVRLFGNRQFSASTGVIGLVFFAAMGAMFFGAFYLQLVRGYGPLASGALFVPFAVGQMVFAPRSAAMVRRFGARVVSTAGLLLVAAGLATWLLIDARTPIAVVAVAYFVMKPGRLWFSVPSP